ncbi:MAG TPA: dienelactone hydrolase family protein [Kofleriaceae bacterium]|nr:dienelactone hydrolase family protein [Kofleriaceae bacterium]
MKVEPHSYPVDDRVHVGYLAVPDGFGDGVARPGVLVFPEAFGVGEHARTKAEQLARLGYVALAVDMYGGGKVYEQLDAARMETAALRANRREWRKRARAAYAALSAHDGVDAGRLAAIGYCFGGATAIELGRAGDPLAAIATFHAAVTLKMVDDQPFSAAVLLCVGADDPLVPPDTVHALARELDAAGNDWQLHFYGRTVHSFTNPAADAIGKPDTFRYSPAADRRSWTALVALLGDTFLDRKQA